MLEILKEAHKAADLFRAKRAEIEAEVSNAERHVKAVVDALNAEEKVAYDAWVTERTKAASKV